MVRGSAGRLVDALLNVIISAHSSSQALVLMLLPTHRVNTLAAQGVKALFRLQWSRH